MIRSFLTIALLIAPATVFAQEVPGEAGFESPTLSNAVYVKADVPLPPVRPARLHRRPVERASVDVATLEPSIIPLTRGLFGSAAVPKPFWLTIGNGF